MSHFKAKMQQIRFLASVHCVSQSDCLVEFDTKRNNSYRRRFVPNLGGKGGVPSSLSFPPIFPFLPSHLLSLSSPFPFLHHFPFSFPLSLPEGSASALIKYK